jgi:hypothetical protein
MRWRFVVLLFLASTGATEVVYDTVSTLPYGADTGSGDHVALICASNGEIGGAGNFGQGGLNLDYSIFGQECDSNANVYLYSGSPFILQKVGEDDYRMSCSIYRGGSDTFYFQPIDGYSSPQHITTPEYEAFFSGTFVNWDTTIAMEQRVYAPKLGGEYSGILFMDQVVFALDGENHERLTVGQIIDWNIPSSDPTRNDAFVFALGAPACIWAVYFQGRDGWDDTTRCQDNSLRNGTQVYIGSYTERNLRDNECALCFTPYGVLGDQTNRLLHDDDSNWPESLWTIAGGYPGANASAPDDDIAGLTTYARDVSLSGSDTVHFFSALLTTRRGDEYDLRASAELAEEWYRDEIRHCVFLLPCCVGQVGNVDHDPCGTVDIGDLTALIHYLYIPPNPAPVCESEANVDNDPARRVDIGDLTALISYLYIDPTFQLEFCGGGWEPICPW